MKNRILKNLLIFVSISISASCSTLNAISDEPTDKENSLVVKEAKTHTAQDPHSSLQMRWVTIKVECDTLPDIATGSPMRWFTLKVTDKDENSYSDPIWGGAVSTVKNGEYYLSWYMAYKPIPAKYVGKITASTIIGVGTKEIPVSVILSHHP